MIIQTVEKTVLYKELIVVDTPDCSVMDCGMKMQDCTQTDSRENMGLYRNRLMSFQQYSEHKLLYLLNFLLKAYLKYQLYKAKVYFQTKWLSNNKVAWR